MTAEDVVTKTENENDLALINIDYCCKARTYREATSTNKSTPLEIK